MPFRLIGTLGSPRLKLMAEKTVCACRTGPFGLKIPTVVIRSWFIAGLALFMVAFAAIADEQADAYLRIFQNIQSADALEAAGNAQAALAKYQQAYTDLVKFRKAYPTYEKEMVGFRLNYLTQKVTALNEKVSAPAAAPAVKGTNATAAKGQEKSASAPSTGQPLVKLIEPGAEPRKLLRLRPKAGDEQTVTLTVETAVERSEGQGQALYMKVPPMVTTMASTIKAVAPDGDISYQNVITDASAGPEASGTPPGIGAALNAAFAGLKGLTTSGVLSDRGFSKRMEQASESAAAKKEREGKPVPAAARLLQGQMEASMTMLTTPLPEEPVGVGARWEVTMAEQGLGNSAKVICQVVAIDGDRVTAKLDVAISARAPEQMRLSDAGKMEISGNGDLTIDLTRIIPAQGHLKQYQQMADIGGTAKNAGGRIVSELRIETK